MLAVRSDFNYITIPMPVEYTPSIKQSEILTQARSYTHLCIKDRHRFQQLLQALRAAATNQCCYDLIEIKSPIINEGIARQEAATNKYLDC